MVCVFSSVVIVVYATLMATILQLWRLERNKELFGSLKRHVRAEKDYDLDGRQAAWLQHLENRRNNWTDTNISMIKRDAAMLGAERVECKCLDREKYRWQLCPLHSPGYKL